MLRLISFVFIVFAGLAATSCGKSSSEKSKLNGIAPGGSDDIPMHHKAVRPFDEALPYAYAPNIVYTADGNYHMLYCGSSHESGGDSIRYVYSSDRGKTWSKPETVHWSKNTTTYHFQVCDPSIVYYPPHNKWYLYYSSSYINSKGDPYKTLVFLARSDSISGPYETYTASGWSLDKRAVPKPIIEPFDKTEDGKYGAGQTTVYLSADNKIHIWFTDDSKDPDLAELGGAAKIYKVTSGDQPFIVSRRVYTGVTASSVDVKYDMASRKMQMFYIENEHRPAARFVRRQSTDGGYTWTSPQIVCDHETCFPDYTSNPGVAGDLFGNLLPGVYGAISDTTDSHMIGYGGPIDPIYTGSTADEYRDPSASRWDLYVSRMNLLKDQPCRESHRQPLLKFGNSWSNSALWSPVSLIDGDLSSVYSSYSSPSLSNSNDFQVAVWAAEPGPHPIKSIILHPRKDQVSNFYGDTITAFPLSYDISVTNADNTAWTYLGRFQSQPVHIGMDSDNKDQLFKRAFAANISLQSPLFTWGILIKPVVLGTDNFGVAYLQLAEIQAETWRECQ